VRSVTGPRGLSFVAGALLALAVSGCGNQYRPVVTPIAPTGPAPQPTSYVVAFSQPGLLLPQPGAATPCPNTATSSTTQPGVVTLIDFSGDSVLAQATIGTGPLTFALDSTGSTAYSENCDGTVSTVPLSTTLQSKNVLTTTLPKDASGNTLPTNLLATSAGQFVVEQKPQNQQAIGALTGSPASLKQEISVAPSLINVTGAAGAQYIYAISQGNSTDGAGVTWGQCDPTSGTTVTTNGEADGIQVSTNTVNSRIPVGICPVYGVMTANTRRAFVLNRTSGNVTVIDSSKNQLDTTTTNFLTGNGTIQCNPGTSVCIGKGPVHADLYTPASLLVTANYDDDSISIINVSINGPVEGYTDTPNFGQVLATVKLPAGSHPAAVTVLQDGSRVYTANEGTGTVSVINLSSFTVEETIPVNGHPRSIASTYNAPIGKVYTIAQDSPYMTVIRTDTNIVTSSILLQGNGVDVHTTTQYAGSSSTTTAANTITQSRSAGSGAP
jgi:YVTN family beta-propeller protein